MTPWFIGQAGRGGQGGSTGRPWGGRRAVGKVPGAGSALGFGFSGFMRGLLTAVSPHSPPPVAQQGLQSQDESKTHLQPEALSQEIPVTCTKGGSQQASHLHVCPIPVIRLEHGHTSDLTPRGPRGMWACRPHAHICP